MSETLIILIITTLIGALGTLIWWLINHIMKKADENTESINETNRELTQSINKLQLTLSGLNGIILSLQNENDLNKGSCKERHVVIADTLDDHELRLRTLEKVKK